MVSKLILLQILPLIGAVIVFLLPKTKAKPAALLTIGITLLQLILCFTQCYAINISTGIRALGINLAFNFDRLAFITLIVITTATLIAAVYSLSCKNERALTPSFFGLMLMTLFGTTGVVLANDLIQFYIFWELMLIPAWLMVLNWNEDVVRVKYISLKFFIITHIGAVLMLISILWIYSITGITNMADLKPLILSMSQNILIPITILFFMGFIVKLAIFPFHTWLPDAYTSSVMPATLILVGVLTNIGVYGLIRFTSYFGTQALMPVSKVFMTAGVITIFYGGIMALVEKNIKRILAYSSMSQMGYILFAAMSLMPIGLAGAEFNLINQAATKMVLFIGIGAAAAYAGTFEIDNMGGLAKKIPYVALFSIIAVFSLVGAPPAMGFWPELFTFSAGFTSGKILLSVIALLGSLISVGYGLRLVRYVFFGPEKEIPENSQPVGWPVYVPLLICAALVILIGIFPALVFNTIRESINEIGFLFGS